MIRKGKKNNLRKKFNKDGLTYIQLRKYRNIAIYQVINNDLCEIMGFQVFVIHVDEFKIKDIDNQTFIRPRTEKYDFNSELIKTYKEAIHVYTQILKQSVEVIS